MKVLQILPELNAGGVERGTLEISEYLMAQGHESLVVSHGGRLVDELQKKGGRHVTLPVHKKSLFSLLQVGPLRRLFATERPDILHVRSRVPAWLAWLAWRNMDAKIRPHLVSTVHGFYSVNAYSAIMTRGERVIAVSESIRDYVLKSFPQTPATAIRVIPRGIEPADYPRGFQPSEEWLKRWHVEFPQLVNKTVLLLPGRITRLKGHEDFLRLIAALRAVRPEVHGLIVGDAHPRKVEYLAEVRALTEKIGLSEHVTFIGHRNDLKEIMAVSRIVFSLSTQPESFGRTTLEAIALGRPVIGYDHGGVAEQLGAFFPAGLVPLRDGARVYATTLALLDGSQTPQPLTADYTRERMCARTLEIYRELSGTR